MAAAEYAELIRGFREAWAKARTDPTLRWHSKSGWDHEVRARIQKQGQKIIGHLYLPLKVNPHDRAPRWGLLALPSNPELEPACSALVALSNRAGAALPEKIRSYLTDFCAWNVTEPASWWYALLWFLYGEPPHEPDGRYRRETFLLNPFRRSIQAIEECGLTSETPGLPDERQQQPGGERAQTTANPKRRRAWTQPEVDDAIRKRIEGNSTILITLAKKIAAGKTDARAKARKLFGRNELARQLECPPAMISKSQPWKSVAAQLRLSGRTPGVGRGNKIGYDKALEDSSEAKWKQLAAEQTAEEAADEAAHRRRRKRSKSC